MPLTYVDATHLTRAERKPYVEIGDWYGCDVEVWFFDVPVEICLERNASRERVVPPEAIHAMAARFEVPELEEGFSRIMRETDR